MTEMKNVKLATRSGKAIHSNDGSDRPACGADGRHGHVPSVLTDADVTCKRCSVIDLSALDTPVTTEATYSEQPVLMEMISELRTTAYEIVVWGYVVATKPTHKAAVKYMLLMETLNPDATIAIS